MRKFLVFIIIVLILVLAFFFIRDGVNIGSAEVLGVYEIDALNNELDTKLNEALDVTEVQFKSKTEELNYSLNQLSTEREKYETVLEQSSESDIAEALKKEKYEIEKLWIAIGNYADEHKVKVNMQITLGSSGLAEVKDLNFIVNGSYTGITEFVYDLEDDSELEFKIENFKLVPDVENENLKATFVVKDVNVNISNIVTNTNTNNTVNNNVDNNLSQNNINANSTNENNTNS